jgi:UPF0716 protein FxsA
MLWTFRLAPSPRLKQALGLWLLAEALIFLLVASTIGFAAALLLSLVTSLFGWTLLKRTGAAATIKLRAAMSGRVVRSGDPRFADDLVSAGAALGLLLPGFLSDVLGLALLAPPLRSRLAKTIEGHLPQPGQRPSRGDTIDLDPNDWSHDDSGRTGPSQISRVRPT